MLNPKPKNKMINIWPIWSNNFHNAKRFFESKGNIKTKGRLKKKWLDDLVRDLNNETQQTTQK